MPAKFVVQWKRDVVVLDLPGYGGGYKTAWIDTIWPDLATARNKYPENEYREVMTEW